ncbi:hypothetical protein ILYODFUR_039053 [Ilyodon furcidens]|uniref:DED domain-containing protein n=1 Tax=Ilyodon furcidens TaxID=33524 RepID=A0ABV0UDZ8_9TELE
MSAAHLNVVLLEISNQLNNENLESLKFLVRSQIGKQKLERIKTGLQLFEVLIERGRLASDQTDYLANLLGQIHREDLSDKLNSLEIQSGNSDNDISDAEKGKIRTVPLIGDLESSFACCQGQCFTIKYCPTRGRY